MTDPMPAIREHVVAALLDDHPADAVRAIDAIMRELYTLRAQLVSENRRRQDALMAELDAKYGPLS